MRDTDVRTGTVVEVKHPLVQHKLSYLRDKSTPTVHFRKLVNEVTLLLTYEATKDFPTEDAEERLAEAKLTVNRNTVPFDERPPTVASGVRIGTPAATMRGFDEDDSRDVGGIIVDALADGADLNALRSRAEALCAKRPLYPGFRGYTTYVA